MELETDLYSSVRATWPASGRHVLGSFDEDSVVVYQAYKPSIGLAATSDGRLGGGGFSFERMSWIKPNFLWMMYRSGWGTKPEQEVTLALRLKREFFDRLLREAVVSSYTSALYDTQEAWKSALKNSQVRLQRGPDHGPRGGKLERRAVQLGLRGAALREMADSALVAVTDISDFVAEQRSHALSHSHSELRVPCEAVYPVIEPAARRALGIDAPLPA